MIRSSMLRYYPEQVRKERGTGRGVSNQLVGWVWLGLVGIGWRWKI